MTLNWRLWLRLTRPGFLSITAVAVVLGSAVAAACGHGPDGVRFCVTLVLALAAHAGANVLNDVCDAQNGADAANQSGIFPFTGGSRLIQKQEVTPEAAHNGAVVLLAACVGGGLVLSLHTGPGLLVLGALGLFLVWAYSSPPLALMSRGLGEWVVALCWAMVVVGADYVQRKAFFVVPWAVSLSFGLMVANILLINGFPDAASDALVGKNTLAVRLGPSWAALLYTWLAMLAHAVLALGVWACVQPSAALWGLCSLPLSLAAALMLWRWRSQAHRLRPAIMLTIAAATVHGLGMALGLWAQVYGRVL